MSLKDEMAADIQEVFFNLEEFGETHTLDGREMTVIIDNMEVVERSKRQSDQGRLDGVYDKQILVYVARSDFGRLPAIGRILQLDNSRYRVTDAVDEGGVYSITLGAVKS